MKTEHADCYLDSAAPASHRNPKRKRGKTLRPLPRLRFGLLDPRPSRQGGAAYPI